MRYSAVAVLVVVVVAFNSLVFVEIDLSPVWAETIAFMWLALMTGMCVLGARGQVKARMLAGFIIFLLSFQHICNFGKWCQSD